MEAEQLADVAAAIADGTPIDWASVESSASTPMEREIVAQLRLLDKVGLVARAGYGALSSNDAGLVSGHTTSIDAARTIDVGIGAAPARWRHLSISEVVGRGGFGVVYRALDRSWKRWSRSSCSRSRRSGARRKCSAKGGVWRAFATRMS